MANGESNGPALRHVRGTRPTADDIAAIGILVPEYCWRNYRKTFAELLADAPGAPNWVKFISGEDGLEAIQARVLTERAAAPQKNLHRKG